MATGSRVESKERVGGYGCEDRWAMDALQLIVRLGREGKLRDTPFYKGCPFLSTEEAAKFGDLIDQGRVKVNLRRSGAHPFILWDFNFEKGRSKFKIEMEPGTAAVIKGLVGFDDCVYEFNNRDLVTAVRDISRTATRLDSGQI